MISSNTTRTAAVVGTLLLLASPALAEKIHVPRDYPDIQAGIDAARDGDVVIVADGVYIGPGNRNIDFLGKAIMVRSKNGPERCIIDCQQEGRGFIFHNNETEASVLKGLTITNGYVEEDNGGGIACLESSPTITNCWITASEAHGSWRGGHGNGGGIYGYVSDARILNCRITRNTASRDGGGISGIHGGITSSMISENVAHDNGGGIFTQGKITGCTIAGNSAQSRGGGIWCVIAELDNCIITGNKTRWMGGGIWGSRFSVTNCAITENDGSAYGGGASCAGDKTSFTHCRFEGNYAILGGGISFEGDEAVITNCLFTENTAGVGAAAVNIESDVVFINCTMTRNSARHNGGAICVYGETTLNNCILWSNTPDQFYMQYAYVPPPQVSFSNVEGGWPGEGNIDAGPLFVAGPSGAYYLSQIAAGQVFNSPCLNAGSGKARDLGLGKFTTRTDHQRDRRRVDMGYHYPR